MTVDPRFWAGFGGSVAVMALVVTAAETGWWPLTALGGLVLAAVVQVLMAWWRDQNRRMRGDDHG